MRIGSFLFSALLLAGCLSDDPPQGLRRTPEGGGPTVIFDLEARPLPDVPLPNDVLTRADRLAPTGRRLNLSLVADTRLEVALREQAFELDGFGTLTAIAVRFDEPLDVAALRGVGRAFEDDPVLVVDVGEGPHFGERFDLDIGRGHFPLDLPSPDAYFDQDPRAGEGNLLFETVDEDNDGDGVLDPREDTDADGRLDRPNTLDGELLTFYERETDTLLLRPLEPLRPGRTYAVVLTDDVVGADGKPVRSPFEWVHHNRQTEALQRLPQALEKHGVAIGDVAFAWTFTTQSVTRDLVELRRGLHGAGPFAQLGQDFQPDVVSVEELKPVDEADAALLRTAELQEMLRAVLPQTDPNADVEGVVATYEAVDYLVSARFSSPYLLADDDGHIPRNFGGYPADDDETFRLDYEAGEAGAANGSVSFWCTVPKPAFGRRAPYPVVLHAHRFGASRLDALHMAGVLARWGFATCALDATGHGVSTVDGVDERLRAAVMGRRARDLDNDGDRDPGGDTFTTDLLHSRDMLRQTVLDWLQLVRVLRALDGRRRWNAAGVESDVAGDFDGDGRVDFGGPTVGYHMVGVGYGAMVATIVAALDPAVVSVAPVAGGGSLTDIAVRSDHEGIPESFVLGAIGPLIVGYPSESATTVSFLVGDANRVRHADEEVRRGLPFARFGPLVPGDRVVLTNLRSGRSAEATVNGAGGFRVSVAADAMSATELRVREDLRPAAGGAPVLLKGVEGVGDPLRLEAYDATGRLKRSVDRFELSLRFRGVEFNEARELPLVAIAPGFGLRRQSPGLRRHVQVAQTLLEAADAANYARHLIREPLLAPTDVLMVLTAGDTEVPIASGLTLARAAGLLTREADARLIAAGVTRGLARVAPLVDVDDLSDGTDDTGAERFDPPLRAETTQGGASGALRVALLDRDGVHGFGAPAPGRAWDGPTYLGNLLGQFFATGSAEHRPCLSTSSCEPPPAED